MGILNRLKHLFSRPYIAFYDSITRRNFRDALYYIEKMSDRDINRPVSEYVARQVTTSHDYTGLTPLMLVALFTPRHSELANSYGDSKNPGRLGLFKTLLNRGANPYYLNQTPVDELDMRTIFAARDSFFHMVSDINKETLALLTPYLNVEKPVTNKGDNILMVAMEHCWLNELLDTLTPAQIKEGLLYCNNDGFSTLTFAAQKQSDLGNFEVIVQRAKELGIDLNTPDRMGRTAASCCLGWQTDSTFKMCFLRDNGLDFDAPVYNGETLLMKTIRENGNFVLPSFQAIVAYSDVNTRTEKGGPTALCLAASRSEYGTISLLLGKGAKVFPQDEQIVVCGLFRNDRLDWSEKEMLLQKIKEQMPADNFKSLLDKGLRDFYQDDENCPLSPDISLIRKVLEDDKSDMALFLMDNGFSPLDRKGRSSDALMFQNPEFKDLLMLYEELFETNGSDVLTDVKQEDVDVNAFFYNNEQRLQLNLLCVLGQLTRDLDNNDQQALVNGNVTLSRPGLFTIKRYQYSLNQMLREKE